MTGSRFDGPPRVAARAARWTWYLVAFGAVLRLVRYLLRFPLWGDEAFVAANFLERDYWDLLGPLEYHQICPPLYLWLVLSVVKLAGFNEYTLRLPALLAGLASLLLFRRLALRVLGGTPAVLAVAIFAVAYYPFRHAAEVKPYATDLFAALVLLTPAAEWLVQGGRRWLWWLALLAPLAIGLSYPAVFVAGGVGLALGLEICRQRRWTDLPAWCGLQAAIAASFGVVFLLSTDGQYRAESGSLLDYWAEGFPPPLTQPLGVIAWLWRTHAGYVTAYPIGGKHGASLFSWLAVLAGIAAFARRRQLGILALLVSPSLLAIVAAVLGRYPYGGSTRVVLYLAGPFCLLIAAGTSAAIAAAPGLLRSRAPRLGAALTPRRLRPAVVGMLVVLGLGFLVKDLVRPYKTPADAHDRAFARWFWNDQAYAGELVCAKTDLGKDFFPGNFEWGQSALYWCNQRIYAADHRGRAPRARPAEPQPSRPLRCVVFSVPGLPCDEAALAEWLAEMQSRYRLAGTKRYLVNVSDPKATSIYDVYEFAVAATAGPASTGEAAAGRAPRIADHPPLPSRR